MNNYYSVYQFITGVKAAAIMIAQVPQTRAFHMSLDTFVAEYHADLQANAVDTLNPKAGKMLVEAINLIELIAALPAKQVSESTSTLISLSIKALYKEHAAIQAARVDKRPEPFSRALFEIISDIADRADNKPIKWAVRDQKELAAKMQRQFLSPYKNEGFKQKNLEIAKQLFELGNLGLEMRDTLAVLMGRTTAMA